MPFRRALNRLIVKEARNKTAVIEKVKAAKRLILVPRGWITPATEEERVALCEAEALLRQHGRLPPPRPSRMLFSSGLPEAGWITPDTGDERLARCQANSRYFPREVEIMLEDYLANAPDN